MLIQRHDGVGELIENLREIPGIVPHLEAVIVILGVVTVWKLPMICCEWWRCVRYLPVIGCCYYGLLVPLVVVACKPDWWDLLLLLGMVGTADWLLPDPFTYFFSPSRRRAVARAIMYLEAKHRVIYGMVRVLGYDAGRTIVSLAIAGGKPPRRRFLAVAHDGEAIEELSFDAVAAKYGVQPWF